MPQLVVVQDQGVAALVVVEAADLQD